MATGVSLSRPAPVRLARRRPLPGRPALQRHWRWAVIAGFTVVLTVVELRHEPWFDEAQAWLLARDASPWELLAHRLHYEGTPGLWHLLLMPLAKAGLPFRTVSVMAAVFALMGVVVFVRRAPLPAAVVAAVPFTYFVLFQYGVVARSYSLLLLLMALIASGWRTRHEHPVRHGVLLALLSEVSLHGLIVAAAILVADVPAWRRAWPGMPEARRRATLRVLAALAVLTAATFVELWPTADNSGGGGWHLSVGDVGTALSTFVHNSPVPLLAIPALIVLGWWFVRRGVAVMAALSMGGLTLLFVLRYASPWHGGVVFLTLLFLLWISWPDATDHTSSPLPDGRLERLRLATIGCTLVLVATQLWWSASAVRFDLGSSYSGTAAAAQYISDNLRGRSIDAVGKWSMAILAYFPTNVFLNAGGEHAPAYWPWSYAHNPLRGGWPRILRDHPDAIVVTLKSRGAANIPCVPGYRRVAVFPGEVYFGTGPWESEAVVVYRPAGPAAAATSRVRAGCGSV